MKTRKEIFKANTNIQNISQNDDNRVKLLFSKSFLPLHRSRSSLDDVLDRRRQRKLGEGSDLRQLVHALRLHGRGTRALLLRVLDLRPEQVLVF